ncbi:MAG: alpha/beta fold hydrolase [Deltaproteobacteria bacterium]|nr:alpha/beta fold hydrolase [Deltaproteobacteria bacterium]
MKYHRFILVAGLTLCLNACDDEDKKTEESPITTDANGLNPAEKDASEQNSVTPDARAMDAMRLDGGTTEPEEAGRRFDDADFKPLADIGTLDNDEQCDDPVNEEDCDKTKVPFVFVHGTVGSGDNLAAPFQLFASNGYCSSYLKAVDYNSLGEDPNAELDAIIAQLQSETGFDEVDLSGHSQGSGHAARYAAANPDKIRRYVHLAGGCPGVARGTAASDETPGADPGDVPTLTLSSIGDMPVERCGTTANFCHQNAYIDHFAVASSVESFVEMYQFLNDGEKPETTTVKCEDNIIIEGRAITFGDSLFVAGGKIEVYELGNDPWKRDAPVYSFEVGEDGNVGPFEGKRGVYYEFKMIPPADKAESMGTRYTYMPPFTRSDRWIRFLYRSENPTATATNALVNFSEAHSVMVVRMKRGGFHYPIHGFTVDGFDALNEINAPTPGTNVGYYLFDASGEGEGESNGGNIVTGLFVNSCDIFMPAAAPRFIEVKMGRQTVKVPNWPSAEGTLSLILFD